jgi:hypothetical protein
MRCDRKSVGLFGRIGCRMTNRPGNSGIVPEIKALSRIPESIPYVSEILYFFLKCYFFNLLNCF